MPKASYKNYEKLKEELSFISFVYVCPGGRNQDIFEILEEISIPYKIMIDERTASFNALGRSKYTQLPVALVTTSGSAVGHALPALMEAYHSNISLVIISFDRPERLKNIDSPQTTSQEKALRNYIRSENLTNKTFPMHINILADLENQESRQQYEINNSSCPLIIHNSNKHINTFIKNIKDFYIHYEIESCHFGKSDNTYTDEYILELYSKGYISEIVSIGKIPNTSLWRKLEKIKHSHKIYNLDTQVPNLTYAEVINKIQFNNIKFTQNSLKLTEHINFIEKLQRKYPKSEASIIKQIIEFNVDAIFFIGNSLPIRDLKHTTRKKGVFYANRGLNGIDGLISTANGIASATNKKVIAIVGDQSFIHDSNFIFQQIEENLEVHIINNHGGEIFKRFNFKKEMINSHTMAFEDITNLPSNVFEHLVNSQQSFSYNSDYQKGLYELL